MYGFTASAWALGTPAGTLIDNTVTVRFQVNDQAGTDYIEQAHHRFVVAELIRSNVSVLDNQAVAVTAAMQDVPLSFQLTNTGNGHERFLLDVRLAADAAFSPTLNGIWLETNGVPGWQADDTRYQPSVGVDLAADEAVELYVLGDMPESLHDEAQAPVTLQATAATPGVSELNKGEALTPETNSEDEEAVQVVVAQAGAQHAAEHAYIASGIELTVQKGIVAVDDPYGGSLKMSGAEVSYEITVAITGQGVARDLVIQDAVPASMYYKANSLRFQGEVLTDRQDSDVAYFDAAQNTIFFKPGAIEAPAQQTLRLTLSID